MDDVQMQLRQMILHKPSSRSETSQTPALPDLLPLKVSASRQVCKK
jgi:hypothetical protein